MRLWAIMMKELRAVREDPSFHLAALVLWVGGGGFGPLSYFGAVANILGALNPATYAIELVRWCYFGGAGALAFQSAALVLAAAVSLAVVLAVYSRWTRGEEGR